MSARVCMYACVFVWVYGCVCICEWMHVCMDACVRACVRACVCVCVCACFFCSPPFGVNGLCPWLVSCHVGPSSERPRQGASDTGSKPPPTPKANQAPQGKAGQQGGGPDPTRPPQSPSHMPGPRAGEITARMSPCFTAGKPVNKTQSHTISYSTPHILVSPVLIEMYCKSVCVHLNHHCVFLVGFYRRKQKLCLCLCACVSVCVHACVHACGRAGVGACVRACVRACTC
jgi:hypothetical protein